MNPHLVEPFRVAGLPVVYYPGEEVESDGPYRLYSARAESLSTRLHLHSRHNPFVARVAIESLSKTYPDPSGGDIRALDSVTFAAEDNQLLALLGPSGSGKTTILRLIAGLESPASGVITIAGRITNDLPPAERDLAMVFQHPALYPEMTAGDNIGFGLKIRKVPRAEIQQRVRATAQLLGISACLERRPMHLSGGECQRVALARALVRNPGVLLLDEPLSSLDAPARTRMRSELARIQRDLRSTMIYVTHDQAEALSLGHRVVVLDRGRVQQTGTPNEIYQRPANLFVAGFLGTPPMNLLEGVLFGEGEGLVFRGHESVDFEVPVAREHAKALASHVGKPIVFGMRPEHIIPAGPVAQKPGDAIVTGMISSIETTGAEGVLQITIGSVTLAARCSADTPAVPNSSLRLQISMARAHYFEPETGKVVV